MRRDRVCPVERAGTLDSTFRRWLQNPEKILRPYLREGMTAVDLGCGPGFFTVDMAIMVGESGRVIGSDLQEGMLRTLADKIKGPELKERIVLHKCEKERIGISERADFILAFYMVHEVPDQDLFFREIEAMLNTDGLVLIVEPPIHVSTKDFAKTIATARQAGLTVIDQPKILLSKAVLLKKVG